MIFPPNTDDADTFDNESYDSENDADQEDLGGMAHVNGINGTLDHGVFDPPGFYPQRTDTFKSENYKDYETVDKMDIYLQQLRQIPWWNDYEEDTQSEIFTLIKDSDYILTLDLEKALAEKYTMSSDKINDIRNNMPSFRDETPSEHDELVIINLSERDQHTIKKRAADTSSNRKTEYNPSSESIPDDMSKRHVSVTVSTGDKPEAARPFESDQTDHTDAVDAYDFDHIEFHTSSISMAVMKNDHSEEN